MNWWIFYAASLVLDIKKNDDASNVVDHILLFLPLFKGSSNKILSRSFSISLQEVWIDNVGNLLVL